jgi:PncC family amidohydrolase
MAKLEAEIGELVRGYQAKTGKLLTIGTSESATGGRMADRLTNVPGSSDYFRGSLVAYSNEMKIGLLGVKKETLESYGAVSRETAIEMAEGGRRLLKVDICLSDTGIAGPSGATTEKPLGLFYVGLAAEDGSLADEYCFQGDREQNKREAAEAGLSTLKQHLLRLG